MTDFIINLDSPDYVEDTLAVIIPHTLSYVPNMFSADLKMLISDGPVQSTMYVEGYTADETNVYAILSEPAQTTGIDLLLSVWKKQDPILNTSGNVTFDVYNDEMCTAITILPSNTETIRIGTTNGGQDILADTVFTSSTLQTVSINKAFSNTATTTLYINGSTHSTTYKIFKN